MKEENDIYFQIQPYSEKSKRHNLRTKLKIELVDFNMKKATKVVWYIEELL